MSNRKKCLIGILNRNLPDLSDELYEIFSSLGCDLVLLENGSDPSRYAKNANLFVEETNGAAWGVNKLIQHAIDQNYDYVWVNFNDARVDQPGDFIDYAINEMEIDSSVGLVTAYWPNIWDDDGCPNSGKKEVSFFDPISFVVSLKCVKVISSVDESLTPFWNSLNATVHYNILGPAYRMSKLGFKMITNPNFVVTEKDMIKDRPDKEEFSCIVRGISDTHWKHTLGPALANTWLDKQFPEFSHLTSRKQKRDSVISLIVSNLRSA